MRLQATLWWHKGIQLKPHGNKRDLPGDIYQGTYTKLKVID